MLNLLRSDQVLQAQRGIPTGLVYTQNDKTLAGIGEDALRGMLLKKSWGGLEGREVERVAVDVKEDKINVKPRPVKVEGDLVNVLLQAIDLQKESGELGVSQKAVVNAAIDVLLSHLE